MDALRTLLRPARPAPNLEGCSKLGKAYSDGDM